MALIQFRDLAQQGIIRDVPPHSLPLNAWSAGQNVRFHAGKAMRAPVLKTWARLGRPALFSCAYRPASLEDSIFFLGDDRRIYRASQAGDEDVAPENWTPPASKLSPSSTSLGDVLYLNVPGAAPLFWGPESKKFTPLPGWDKDWSCRSLRTFGNYIVALNVSKGGTRIPQMFKWSDLTLAGQPPSSWDANDPTTNAGENVLEGLSSPIIDGLEMRHAFVVCASDQAYLVQQINNEMIFSFQRLGINGGVIAPNCVAEVNGVHYCFGTSDIYRHDGTSRESIADGRIRAHVFETLDRDATENFFTLYDTINGDVIFAYRSSSSDAVFQGKGCNQAAIFNIASSTWSFIGLPNIVQGYVASLEQGQRYLDMEKAGISFEQLFATYLDLEGGHTPSIVFASSTVPDMAPASRILAYDFVDTGKQKNLAVEAVCNAPAWIERTGIDLDLQGADLATYKQVLRVYPQASFARNPDTVRISVGGALTPAGDDQWKPAVLFDPIKQYKVDVRTGGRYFSYRYQVDALVDFELSGFDCDVASGGRR